MTQTVNQMMKESDEFLQAIYGEVNNEDLPRNE